MNPEMTDVTSDSGNGVLRNRFQQKVEVPIKKLHVTELGVDVWFHGMTAGQRSRFEKQFEHTNGTKSKRKLREIRERLIIETCCDEHGARVFSEDDVELLSEQPITMVERMVPVAQDVSGFNTDEIDDLVKN